MMYCLLFCLAFSESGVPGAGEIWERANAAFQDGRYEEAVKLYESLVEEGYRNGKIHFNLGNAYYRDGQLGKAILNYYRAERFLPGDEDVAHNLALANQQRVDPLIDEETQSFTRSLDRFMYKLDYPVLYGLALVMVVLCGLVSTLMILRSRGRRPLGYVLVIGSLIALFLTMAVFLQHRTLAREDMAVVVAREVNVLSGPSTRETISFTIHEGISCHILDRTEGWYRIRLANGYNGWVRRSDIEII